MLLAACADDIGPVMDDATTTVGNEGFRFLVAGNASRLTYDDVSTSFSTGDSIGCVICTMSSTDTTADDGTTTTTYSYDFLAYSLWTYTSSGTLICKKYWKTPDSGTKLTATTTTEGSATDMVTYSGTNTVVNYSDQNIYLFFHYPYVDPDETTNSLTEVARTVTDETTTYLMGPPSAVASTTTAEDGTTTALYTYPSASKLTSYSWRAWPLSVLTNTSATSNTKGDWMDARYLYGVNPTTSSDITLQFKHRTAAICVTAGETLYDVGIITGATTSSGKTRTEGEEDVSAADDDTSSTDTTDDTSSSTTTYSPIMVGQQIDLASGILTEFTSSTAYTSTDDVYANAYLTTTTDTLYPYKVDSKNYRFYLPAQTGFNAELVYRYASEYTSTTDEDGNTVTTPGARRHLSLATLGKGTLVAGTKYDVNVPALHAFYYMYYSEYTSSSSATLTQNGTESNGVYFTTGVETEGESVNYETSATATISVTSKYTSESKTLDCKTAIKLQSSEATYIQFTLPTTAKVTVYVKTQTSTPTQKVYTTTDGSTYTEASDKAISSSITDTDSGALYGSVELEAGTYRIKKGSNTSSVYAVTVDY